MELLQSPFWITVLAVLASLILLLLHTLFHRRNGRVVQKKLLPKAVGGWPIIGHLFMLSGPDPLHITLSNMADKHGPIFSIQMGSRHGLVVNTWELAKECYKTNDSAFWARPKTAATANMGYNFAMFGRSDHRPYWREVRKIAMLQLLSNKKVTALSPMIEVQIRAMMRSMNEFYHQCSREGRATVADLSKFIRDLTISLTVKMVAGNVQKEVDFVAAEKWRVSVSEFFRMINMFTVSDVLPFLRWVDYFSGMHRAFRRTGRSFDTMLQAWLEELKKMKNNAEEEVDFMTEMLTIADEVAKEFPFFDADTINKATCQTMMLGGIDTTIVTLTWAMSLLLNNQETLTKAQQELDKHVGRGRLVQGSDVEKLIYIQAILKETLRLQPPVPVNIREATKDCTVGSYHIPVGTRLFVNNWKIQRDPRVWPDPLEFRPERFLTSHKDVDVLGHHFELVPFGGGKRTCPGIYMGHRTTQLVLASMLQGFEFMTPSVEVVDMTGSFGLTNMKATPLDVHLKPRLSPKFYV